MQTNDKGIYTTKMDRTVVVTPAMSRLQTICASFYARLIVCLCFVLSHIVPKKRGSLAFYSQHQNGLFAGNLKYVFKHIHEKANGRFSICWFTRDVNTYQKLRQQNYPCHLYRSTPFWQLLRSEFILLDTTPDTFFSLGNYKLIQIWHGSGFKRIGRFKLADSKASMLQAYLAKRAMTKYVLIAATSTLDAQRKQDSWCSNTVQITGAPRNDIFFNPPASNESYKKILGIPSGQRIILYAPTFATHIFPPVLSDEGMTQIESWLTQTNSYLLIKPHHAGSLPIINTSASSRILSLVGKIDDVQELLLETDILISDYSSISTDFAVSRKPIIFYLHNADYVRQAQSFYYDPEIYIPGPIVYNEADLLKTLSDLSWFDKPEYQEKYDAFARAFHIYNDGKSAQRITSAIEKL